MNMAAGRSIMFLNIRVENIEDNQEVYELLRHVKPGWVLENVECERFHGGVVNEMKLFYQREDVTRDDAVIMRVFGESLGDMNPRDTEFLALQVAHAAGCFPTLHASFKNGLVYKYAKGRIPGFKDILKPDVIIDITSKLFRFNNIDLESLNLLDRDGEPAKYKGKSNVFSRIKSLISKIPDQVDEPNRNGRFQSFRQEFTNEVLLQELEFIRQVYKEVEMPFTFSHGDLHLRNMVINDENNEVMFLDFELTGFSYACWDLSYLLAEKPFYVVSGWADKSEPDISEATRLLYIKGYLTAMFKSLVKEEDQISDLDIEFMDLQLKLLDLSVYLNFLAVGLALVTSPRTDSLTLVPLAKEKYISLKPSIYDIKARYMELKRTRQCPVLSTPVDDSTRGKIQI